MHQLQLTNQFSSFEEFAHYGASEIMTSDWNEGIVSTNSQNFQQTCPSVDLLANALIPSFAQENTCPVEFELSSELLESEIKAIDLTKNSKAVDLRKSSDESFNSFYYFCSASAFTLTFFRYWSDSNPDNLCKLAIATVAFIPTVLCNLGMPEIRIKFDTRF